MGYLIPPCRILSIFSCLARVSRKATHHLSIRSYPMPHTVVRRTLATAKADSIRLARFEALLGDEQMDQVNPPSSLSSAPRRYPMSRRSTKRLRPNPRVYQEDSPSPAADPSTATVVEATASSPKASVSDADAVRLARSMALTQSVEPTPSESTTAEPLAKATEGPTPPAATSDHDSSRGPPRSLSAKRMPRFSLW